jgi:hypothetical protein
LFELLARRLPVATPFSGRYGTPTWAFSGTERYRYRLYRFKTAWEVPAPSFIVIRSSQLSHLKPTTNLNLTNNTTPHHTISHSLPTSTQHHQQQQLLLLLSQATAYALPFRQQEKVDRFV